jgi:hypothetical protein
MKLSQAIYEMIEAGLEERRCPYIYITNEGQMCLIGALVKHTTGSDPDPGSMSLNYSWVIDQIDPIPDQIIQEYLKSFSGDVRFQRTLAVIERSEFFKTAQGGLLAILERLNDTASDGEFSWTQIADRLAEYGI